MALVVQNLPAKAGNLRDIGLISGPGISPGGRIAMATHSSILAWRIPWIDEPGGLRSSSIQFRHSVVSNSL